MRRGRKRKHNPLIPKHIDQSALPKDVYFDHRGEGRWYRLAFNEAERCWETRVAFRVIDLFTGFSCG